MKKIDKTKIPASEKVATKPTPPDNLASDFQELIDDKPKNNEKK